jgi:hypothetical protein
MFSYIWLICLTFQVMVIPTDASARQTLSSHECCHNTGVSSCHESNTSEKNKASDKDNHCKHDCKCHLLHQNLQYSFIETSIVKKSLQPSAASYESSSFSDLSWSMQSAYSLLIRPPQQIV